MVRIRRRGGGDLFVDGSIRGQQITVDETFSDKFWGNEANFGVVKTNLIEDGFGSSIDLSNNAVVIAVKNDLTELDSEIGTVSGTIGTVSGEVTTLNNRVKAAEDEINAQSSVFVVKSTGASIESVHSTNSLDLNSRGIEIKEGTSVVSSWNKSKLWVNSADVETLEVGNHLVTKNGDRTIFRPLNI